MLTAGRSVSCDLMILENAVKSQKSHTFTHQQMINRTDALKIAVDKYNSINSSLAGRGQSASDHAAGAGTITHSKSIFIQRAKFVLCRLLNLIDSRLRSGQTVSCQPESRAQLLAFLGIAMKFELPQSMQQLALPKSLALNETVKWNEIRDKQLNFFQQIFKNRDLSQASQQYTVADYLSFWEAFLQVDTKILSLIGNYQQFSKQVLFMHASGCFSKFKKSILVPAFILSKAQAQLTAEQVQRMKVSVENLYQISEIEECASMVKEYQDHVSRGGERRGVQAQAGKFLMGVNLVVEI